MILTVHDELLFEAPEADADEVSRLVASAMEQAFRLSVPLPVEVGVRSPEAVERAAQEVAAVRE